MIDTATNTVLTGTGLPIPVGSTPIGIAVTPDGKHAYVANIGSGTVSVIDTATNTVLTGTGFPIPVGTGPAGVAVTPDGKHAYVANQLSNNVSVIDTATNTVLTGTGFPIPVGGFPRGVGIVPPVPALTVTPVPPATTNIVANAAQGGAAIFSPSSFAYTLSAANGNVQVSITGTPSWLNPSFSSPTTVMPARR